MQHRFNPTLFNYLKGGRFGEENPQIERYAMYGAILGDIIGSPFEFDRGEKTTKFELFSEESQFTDDSVMTVAVAEALMDAINHGISSDDDTVRSAATRTRSRASPAAWPRRTSG